MFTPEKYNPSKVLVELAIFLGDLHPPITRSLGKSTPHLARRHRHDSNTGDATWLQTHSPGMVGQSSINEGLSKQTIDR